jgi:hydroxyethylthiazole kinase-like sugar kinase family protein
LFTHPGAAVALKVGEATDVARVVAGAAAVAVLPMLIAVGSNDIVERVGDTYAVPVAESPDPPATFCWLGAAGCVRTSVTAVTIALTPTPAENHVSACARIDYLQQQAHR